MPENRDAILESLASDDLISKSQNNKWNITNLGAILFAKDLNKFNHLKRKACYIHASLKYIQNDFMTNTSLRERFGIEAKNTAMVSRIIKEVLLEKLICTYDEKVGAKAKSYTPWWAK